MAARLILAGALVLCGLMRPVEAGPWPREEGEAFLSLSREQDRADNSYTSLYAEYGLSRRRTLGLEVGRADVGETSAILWYQKSFDSGAGPNRLSYAMGFGAIRRDGTLLPLSQVALMWGRGFSGIGDGGWITAEARIKVAGKTEAVTIREGLTSVQYAYLTPDIVGKLDLTLGVRPIPVLALVNQLRLEARKESDISAKLASSVVYNVSGPARLELGLIAPLSGPSEAAIRIGTWLEF